MEPIIGQPTGGKGMADSGVIKDSTDADFRKDVMEASLNVPVIVDFWAPWCGPCKQLGPTIEKVVTNARGAVKLVKINIDENPMIAGQLQVQSIPAVFAFYQGRPIDGFMGALPESEIKKFVDNLITMSGGDSGEDPVEGILEQADALYKQGDYATAAGLYGQVLEIDPENIKALGGLGLSYVKLGEYDAVREMLGELTSDKREKSEIKAVTSALDLAEQSKEAAGRVAPLREAVHADPNNHQARYDLAVAQFGLGDTEDAIEHLFHILERNRDWNDGAARLQLLKIFEVLGPTDPLVSDSRRRLSSILFS